MDGRGSPREFFTNWNTYEGPFFTKMKLFTRNRIRTVVMFKGCCGHPGEPGC